MANPIEPINGAARNGNEKADRQPPDQLHQEEEYGKAYDVRLIRRLWRFLIPYKRLFFAALLLLPLLQVCGLAQPYLMKILLVRQWGKSRIK